MPIKKILVVNITFYKYDIVKDLAKYPANFAYSYKTSGYPLYY